jgi:myo-inositol-1-phosphate synthase
MSKKVKLAVVGVGNCASSLIQGIFYYRDKKVEDLKGLMFPEVGGYRPSDIEIVCAWDIDARKVGQDVSEAIFVEPNCTTIFYREVPSLGVKVRKGKVLDGYASHMKDFPNSCSPQGDRS